MNKSRKSARPPRGKRNKQWLSLHSWCSRRTRTPVRRKLNFQQMFPCRGWHGLAPLKALHGGEPTHLPSLFNRPPADTRKADGGTGLEMRTVAPRRWSVAYWSLSAKNGKKSHRCSALSSEHPAGQSTSRRETKDPYVGTAEEGSLKSEGQGRRTEGKPQTTLKGRFSSCSQEHGSPQESKNQTPPARNRKQSPGPTQLHQ